MSPSHVFIINSKILSEFLLWFLIFNNIIQMMLPSNVRAAISGKRRYYKVRFSVYFHLDKFNILIFQICN